MSEHTTTARPADRLTHAVLGLVEDGTLTPQQAAQVVERLRPLVPGPAAPAKAKGPLVEFAGYLGGALFLGGISLVVVPTWDGLPYPARLGLAAAVTVVLVAAAVLIGRPWRRAEEPPATQARLASTLGALAAGAAATTAAVLAPDDLELLIGSVVGLVIAAGGYVALRGAPLLVAGGVASVLALGAALDQAGVTEQAAGATAFALLGAGWLGLGVAGVVRERGVAGLLGGLIGLGAGESASVDSDATALYGLVLGVLFIAAGFGGYLATRRWPLLVPAVLTALIVPPSALANVLESGLAAGATVAAVGAAILAAGGVALLTRRTAAPR